MKTIIFDFDGTLTKKSNEVWRKCWEKIDALDVDEELYNKFDSREFDYDDWCKAIEKEFIKRNFNITILNEIMSNIELMDSIDLTLKELKKDGYDLRILSGGIDYVIYNLLKEKTKYFSEIKCCKFCFDNNGLLTEIINTDSDEEGKGRYVAKLIKESKCNPKDIIFIGNGHNDRFVSSTGCQTICINPNGTNHLDSDIWHAYVENTTDLSDLLSLIKQKKPALK